MTGANDGPAPQAMGLGEQGDEVYAALLAAHDGLDAAASARLNVRLVLLLANAVGDPDAVLDAIAAAAAPPRDPAA